MRSRCFSLKKVLAYVIQPLTYLVNLSFVSGCFPTQLKVGKVVPIHKKHDPQLLDNYRPITVPSNFSKIFEYSFFDRLMNFIENNNIFIENQHGFRVKKSTNSAMLSFYIKLMELI